MKKTYRMALQEAKMLLNDAQIEEYDTDAWLLLAYVCGMDRTAYLMRCDEEMEHEDYEAYIEKVKCRATHKPLQYITGTQNFMGFEFKVNENVLIPRMDTEILVSEAINIIGKKSFDVLDMCTGSGCIGISIAGLCPQSDVDMADISAGAIGVANDNIAFNKVTNAHCIQSDLFENVNRKYDVIVSNPPYIETEVIDTLMPEVKDYEPMLALDGETDGLKFYRTITKQSVSYMKPGGYLIYEIGCNQAEEVSEIMRNNGYTDIRVVRDLVGLCRVVIGKENHNV